MNSALGGTTNFLTLKQFYISVMTRNGAATKSSDHRRSEKLTMHFHKVIISFRMISQESGKYREVHFTWVSEATTISSVRIERDITICKRDYRRSLAFMRIT
jgi:hypothetical protein